MTIPARSGQAFAKSAVVIEPRMRDRRREELDIRRAEHDAMVLRADAVMAARREREPERRERRAYHDRHRQCPHQARDIEAEQATPRGMALVNHFFARVQVQCHQALRTILSALCPA